MLDTKSFGEISLTDLVSSDTIYVNVAKGMPTGPCSCMLHLPSIAPSVDIRNKFKNGQISFDEFSDLYRKELFTNRSKQVSMQVLRSLVAKNESVTLCCYCKDDCHRHVLSDILNKEGGVKK